MSKDFLKPYNKILGVTGHRLNVLGLPHRVNLPEFPVVGYIIDKSIQFIGKEYKPDVVLTGMALGFDLWTADVCRFLNIPFIAYVPFVGQEKLWSQELKDYYHDLLDCAAYVHVVNEGSYAAWKMQTRNEAIVDDSNHLLACFNGKSGGTANCVNYAIRKKREMTIINPESK